MDSTNPKILEVSSGHIIIQMVDGRTITIKNYEAVAIDGTMSNSPEVDSALPEEEAPVVEAPSPDTSPDTGDQTPPTDPPSEEAPVA